MHVGLFEYASKVLMIMAIYVDDDDDMHRPFLWFESASKVLMMMAIYVDDDDLHRHISSNLCTIQRRNPLSVTMLLWTKPVV